MQTRCWGAGVIVALAAILAAFLLPPSASDDGVTRQIASALEQHPHLAKLAAEEAALFRARGMALAMTAKRERVREKATPAKKKTPKNKKNKKQKKRHKKKNKKARGLLDIAEQHERWCRASSRLAVSLLDVRAVEAAETTLRHAAAHACADGAYNLGQLWRNNPARRSADNEMSVVYRHGVELARAYNATSSVRAANMAQASIVSLRFAAEQLEALLTCCAERLPPPQSGHSYEKEVAAYRDIVGRIPADDPEGFHITLSPEDAARVPSYRRPLFIDDKPRTAPGVAARAPRGADDIAEIQRAYREESVVYIDNVLSPETLRSLWEFAARSTIYYEDKPSGYVGAYLDEGFNTALLDQVGEEFRTMFPEIFAYTPLRMRWAYNYDSELQAGIRMHGDSFAVNCNLWVTPDEANLDPSSGGLRVWTVPAPLDWDFESFNTLANADKMAALVAGGEELVIPYRQNRMVLFKSDLFHATDTFRFRSGFAHRRINLTFLFGYRGQGEDAASIAQRTNEAKCSGRGECSSKKVRRKQEMHS